MFNIQEELAKLPLKPGVYLMKDKNEHVIYVGKAIKLRNRVRQYFRESTNHGAKIQRMVEQVRSFEYIVTDSEIEALILECNLIKKYWPKYNTMLKDDKTYPYIKVTVNEEYPRVMLARKIKKDKAKYFGPYTSGLAAKESIELIRKTWKLRTCNKDLSKLKKGDRVCLNYHINQCSGPCQRLISKKEYLENIDEVIRFLNGKYDDVLNLLEKDMLVASENMEFEKAAKIRDKIHSIKVITEKQKIVNTSDNDQDIIGFAKNEKDALVQVFFIRNGQMIGREHLMLQGVEDLEDKQIMSEFIKQFYSGTSYVPKELVLQIELDDKEVISKWLSSLRGYKVYLQVPIKGEKLKLVELAKKNAKLTLDQFGEQINKKAAKTKGALSQLETLLDLEDNIDRIEAYDISNTAGYESVGSMVVFEGGIPKKNDYRKFKIKWVQGPNDYASMEEMLSRRFTHALKEQKEILQKGLDISYGKFTKLPDLILMDGGKGQVNIALKVLDNIGLSIPVCGMVKDDYHRTRGLYFNNEELEFDKHSELFRLITRIQDEAHRFAINYHRNLRSNRQIKSILNDIEGIGPSRRKALMQYFGTIEKIMGAGIEELNKVPGMNKLVAEAVYNFFHKNNDEDKETDS